MHDQSVVARSTEAANKELRSLREIAAAAERSVLNPAWGGVCDEDVALEMALRAGGYLANKNAVDAAVTAR